MSAPDADQVASPSKRNRRKAAARDRWSEEQLLTSEKSELIGKDLVKLLAKPEAWNLLEESEKREILALLPADTHPEVDLKNHDPNVLIPPLPESFLRYSNNWREGIRQFQSDLENGRYDPEWLRQAESARRQRLNGEFDDFKEREFEQFWGQKQRMDMKLLAGESARIRLETLVEAGVILLGDVWRFTYVFGKGDERIIVDKEARVHEIHGAKLTFVIPTGTRAFLASVSDEAQKVKAPELLVEETQPNNAAAAEATTAVQSNGTKHQEVVPTSHEQREEIPVPVKEDKAPDNLVPPTQIPCPARTEENQHATPTVQVVIVSPRRAVNTNTDDLKRAMSQSAMEPSPKRKRGRPRKIQPRKIKPVEPEAEAEAKSEEPNQIEKDDLSTMEIEEEPIQPKPLPPVQDPAEQQPPLEENNSNDLAKTIFTNEAETTPASSPLSEPPEDLTPFASQVTANDSEGIPMTDQPNEIIVPDIKTPNMLITKILQIDGRCKEGARTANAWKEIRCYRKNQDMGSLWDVRQAWYVKQSPKEGRDSRRQGFSEESC